MPDGERRRQFSNSQVREMDPLHCYVLEFFRLRKFSSRSMVTVIPLAERLFHHGDREGHDDQTEKAEPNLKKMVFLRITVVESFRGLRKLPVVRGYQNGGLLALIRQKRQVRKFNFFAAFAPLREIFRVRMASSLCGKKLGYPDR